MRSQTFDPFCSSTALLLSWQCGISRKLMPNNLTMIILLWAGSSFNGSCVGLVDKNSGIWSSVSTSVLRLSVNKTQSSPVSVLTRRFIAGRRPEAKKLNILQPIIQPPHSRKKYIPSNRSSRVQFHDLRLSFVGAPLTYPPQNERGRRKAVPI